MNLAFPLQRVSLKVWVTPAQYTLLFFLTGRRFETMDTLIKVDGRSFDESFCQIEYLYSGRKSPLSPVEGK